MTQRSSIITRRFFQAVTLGALLASGAALFLTSAPAQAQDIESTSSPSSELRQIIRERIEETIQDRGADTPDFIGTLGTITRVGTSTINFTDTLGLDRTVELNEYTTLLLDGDPAELADLSIGAGITVMGIPRDELVIEGRRLLVQAEDFTDTRTVHLGTITEVTRSELSMVSRQTSETLTFDLIRASEYEDILGNTITTAALEEDQSVLVITDENDDEERYVVRLRLLVPVEQITE